MQATIEDKLIIAGKILVAEGLDDYVRGHLTVRAPADPNRILMKPQTIGMEEITRDNITVVDIEGAKISGPLPRHGEVFIHTEIMRARPEIHSVVHVHPQHAIAFSSLGKPLLPISQEGAIFCDGLPVFDEKTDLILTQNDGKAVARKLGNHRALILRNHGIVTCGETVEEAVVVALALEQACKIQLLAEAGGGPRLVGNPEDNKRIKGINLKPNGILNTFNYLARKIGAR